MGIRQLMDFFETDGEYVRKEIIGSEHTAELHDARGDHRLARINRMSPYDAVGMLAWLCGHSPEALDTYWREEDQTTAE